MRWFQKIVLMHDRDQGRLDERHTAVPVPREPKPLGIDLDLETICRVCSGDTQSLIIRSII
ncbi:MAG: hypothetical protein NVSMB9_21040 [Isosphaeraceae bacterium]